MMGPEAMGVANANLQWTDEKVCRNFLCGTCPHILFTNTVSFDLQLAFMHDKGAHNARLENRLGSVSEITHGTLEDRVPASP